MKEIKEYSLQLRGMMSIERMPHFDKDVEFGLQVGIDGRVWVCVNGVSFMRFKPSIKISRFDAHEALRETARIWNWVADHPLDSKEFAPDVADYQDAYFCPCCYYVQRVGELDIEEGMDKEACEALCPMWEAWGYGFCERRQGSPYRMVNRVKHTYDRAFFALLIVEWAEYLLIEDGGKL